MSSWVKLPLVAALLLALFPLKAQQRLSTVEAKHSLEDSWKAYPTRTMENLPAAVTDRVDSGLSKYGGLLSRKTKATGFFHTTRLGDRWWLVDPEGCLFINKGVVSVATVRSPAARNVMAEKFGSESNWATQTVALLQEHGFNGIGAWSDTARLQKVPHPMPYTRICDFMSSYGRQRRGVYQKSGHTGYLNDCIFVFDPEFTIFCQKRARELKSTKDDPWLLGYFSDNELPFKREALKDFLKLPANDAGYQFAWEWLRARYGKKAGMSDIAEQDQNDFLALVVEQYYRIVSHAIRDYDPNHLFLGSRFYGADMDHPEVFRAAGPYVDVVAVNYYQAWTPDREKLEMWTRASGRPCLITEWYAKGLDSGLPNKTGAGWVVRTQRDRGLFYQNFTLGLLEAKTCVGWHWFKYADNDPEETDADPSNLDSNKGLLTSRYEPYTALLQAMKQVNDRTYSLVEYFDQEPMVQDH